VSWLDATPDLLEVARSTLRGAVLPAVAAERRYEAAMVANALGVAARELRLGPAAREAERADLAALLDAPDATLLDELRRRLCRELRAGGWGPPGGDEARLRALLRAGALRRLAISNPDRLGKATG
jgi:hypothetical protein